MPSRSYLPKDKLEDYVLDNEENKRDQNKQHRIDNSIKIVKNYKDKSFVFSDFPGDAGSEKSHATNECLGQFMDELDMEEIEERNASFLEGISYFLLIISKN